MSIRGGQLPRLAMACWSHDWLMRRDAPQGEYRSLTRVLDELCERGYNALRVDAFPHLIAAREDSAVEDRFEVPRAGEPSVWMHPRNSLVELATLAKARNIRLWLTSEFLHDTQARRSFVRRPRDFVNVWSQTLTLLRDRQLLDTVVAVDFCHEFTDPDTTHGAYRALFNRHPRSPLARLADWTKDAERSAEEYLLTVPRALRARFPDIAFGVSVNGHTEKHIRKLDTTELDFIDTHLWLDDDPRVGLMSASPLALSSNRFARGLQTRVAALAWRARGTFWLQRVEDRIETLGEFSRLRRLQPVICAGYVRLASESQADWRWVREVSESIIKVSLSQGMSALITAHHARPRSAEFWSDIEWHQAVTHLILTGPGR